jgi:preprotein translocase subunit YajC
MTKLVKVSELQPGDKILFNGKCEVFVNSVEREKVMVSKQNNSPYQFSIDIYSHKYKDLFNRVEKV